METDLSSEVANGRQMLRDVTEEGDEATASEPEGKSGPKEQKSVETVEQSSPSKETSEQKQVRKNSALLVLYLFVNMVLFLCFKSSEYMNFWQFYWHRRISASSPMASLLFVY